MGFPLLTPEENFPFQRISWSPTRPRLWRAARALISCCYTTLGRAASPYESSNNLNNINGLKFYHETRGNLGAPVFLGKQESVARYCCVVVHPGAVLRVPDASASGACSLHATVLRCRDGHQGQY